MIVSRTMTVHLNKVGICFVLFCFLVFGLYITHTDSDLKLDKYGPTVNIKNLLVIATELAIRGGEQVINVKESANLKVYSKGKTEEGANNPVTEADFNSHCVMYFGLKREFPFLKIISEEQVSEEKCKGLAFQKPNSFIEANEFSNLVNEELPIEDMAVWIDPLDATQEFTENLLEYVTTLVCVAYKGRPIAGVIHRPFGKDPKTSWAWINKGMSDDLLAYKNVKRDPAVIVSRSHSGTVVNIIHRALGPDVRVIKAGGAGYKVMQLVSGNASAYVHHTAIKKWDICAGEALLSAVGGKMTTITDEYIDYAESAQPVNRGGILATIADHAKYVDKFHRALRKDENLNL